MKLRVVDNGGAGAQLQRSNEEGKVYSVRPATAEEAWMFGRLDEAETEVGRLETLVERLHEDLNSANARVQELEKGSDNE